MPEPTNPCNPYQPPADDAALAPQYTGRGTPIPLTVLDWIGVALTVLVTLALAIVPLAAAPAFGGMYREFGSSKLPWLTRLALAPWLGPVLAAAPAALTTLALARSTLGIGRRRALVVLAFLLALVGAALVVVGFYQPVFELAGAISGS